MIQLYRRLLRYVPLVSALLALSGSAWCTLAHARSSDFAEVELEMTGGRDEFGRVPAVVASVARVRGGSVLTPVERLMIQCPSVEARPWFTWIAVGDTLRLRWREESRGSRGFLFFGGGGGRARLEIPDTGWNQSCRCEKNRTPRLARLVGTFANRPEGHDRSLTLTGRGQALPLRLLPFFFKGGRARPPERVRVRLAWDMESEQSSSSSGAAAARTR